MKKEKVTEIMLGLWSFADQAGYDMIVKKALSLMPIKDQLELIEDLLNGEVDSDSLRLYRKDYEIIKKKAECLLNI